MAKYAVSFCELHNPLFMQGVNLSNKINALTRNAKLEYDTEQHWLVVYFKGKASVVPSSNISSMDLIHLQDAGIELPPAAVPPKTHVPQPAVVASNDFLIQQSRNIALGLKHTAQVSDPSRPEQGLTSLQSPPKWRPNPPKPAPIAPFDPAHPVSAPAKKPGRPPKAVPGDLNDV